MIYLLSLIQHSFSTVSLHNDCTPGLALLTHASSIIFGWFAAANIPAPPRRVASILFRAAFPKRLAKAIFSISTGLILAGSVTAAEIRVSATDNDSLSIAKIEGARLGDTVVIGPGVYRFRVYLTRSGSLDRPIIIRASDRANRPVWDLSGKAIADWTGSYQGVDRGRAIWQITGAHYEISGIVFRNGSDRGVGDGSGLRLKSSRQITIRDCLFQFNDNGIQGAGADTLVEFSEFDRNGLSDSLEYSHNIYIHGGDIAVRFSYIHDPRRGQNLHIRANRATFEYNLIARAKTYMADMMTCTMPPCDSDQYLLLRGNVFIQGNPNNDRQIFAIVNDQKAINAAFHLRMINNTLVGNGGDTAVVHLVNADKFLNRSQTVFLANNAFIGIAKVLSVDRAKLENWAAQGTGNWFSLGTHGMDAFENSVAGVAPGVRNLAANDLVPVAPSGLIGAATGVLPDLPDRELYFEMGSTLHWRPRRTVQDIGAFESTTTGEVMTYGNRRDRTRRR